jgi:E3 ubiquitin-protein ligase BRE1
MLELQTSCNDNINDMPLEELRAKYTSLERQYSMLNTELTSMQTL